MTRHATTKLTNERRQIIEKIEQRLHELEPHYTPEHVERAKAMHNQEGDEAATAIWRINESAAEFRLLRDAAQLQIAYLRDEKLYDDVHHELTDLRQQWRNAHGGSVMMNDAIDLSEIFELSVRDMKPLQTIEWHLVMHSKL